MNLYLLLFTLLITCRPSMQAIFNGQTYTFNSDLDVEIGELLKSVNMNIVTELHCSVECIKMESCIGFTLNVVSGPGECKLYKTIQKIIGKSGMRLYTSTFDLIVQTYIFNSDIDVEEGELLKSVNMNIVTELYCSIECIKMESCIGFTLNVVSGPGECKLYKTIQKIIGKSMMRLYTSTFDFRGLHVPFGRSADIRRNMAFMFISDIKATWTESFDECKKYDGFRLIRPKTMLQFDYAMEKCSEETNGFALDMYCETYENVFFGDGTPMANSEISHLSVKVDDNLPNAVHLRWSVLHDIGFYQYYSSLTICENIETIIRG